MGWSEAKIASMPPGLKSSLNLVMLVGYFFLRSRPWLDCYGSSCSVGHVDFTYLEADRPKEGGEEEYPSRVASNRVEYR